MKRSQFKISKNVKNKEVMLSFKVTEPFKKRVVKKLLKDGYSSLSEFVRYCIAKNLD